MRILSFVILILFAQTIYAMNIDLNKHLKELEENGVTVIPQVFSHDDMIKYKAALMPIVEKVDETLKTPGKPRIFHNDGNVN